MHVCIRRATPDAMLICSVAVILMFVPLIIFALGSSPRDTIAFQIPKAHGGSAFGRPSSRRCTISRDSTLLRLWNEVFWGARFIPAIGFLLASKHRSQVILFREDFQIAGKEKVLWPASSSCNDFIVRRARCGEIAVPRLEKMTVLFPMSKQTHFHIMHKLTRVLQNGLNLHRREPGATMVWTRYYANRPLENGDGAGRRGMCLPIHVRSSWHLSWHNVGILMATREQYANAMASRMRLDLEWIRRKRQILRKELRYDA